MRMTLFALGASSLALAGCAAEPVDIPADFSEAGKVCFVVKAMTMRDNANKTEDDPVTLTEYSQTIQFPMIASTKADEFTIETVLGQMPDIDAMLEELSLKDYKAAVPECEKKFGIAGKDRKPSLPEGDTDAAFSCFAMSQFFIGGVEDVEVDDEGEKEYFKKLDKQLETALDGLVAQDAELLAKIETEGQAMITDGLKQAFSQGDPIGYLKACDARFPAE